MNIHFTKMHGIGNDYIYVNCLDKELQNPGRLAEVMSPRRFSVGGDGLVLICSSKVADAKMRMFNLDGSEGNMCGNAIRCVGKYLFDNGICPKKTMTVETKSGIKTLRLHILDGKTVSVTVDMGTADFAPEAVPVLSEAPMLRAPVTVADREWEITAVSMGNPHAVVYTDDPNALELEKIGPAFENHPLFPEKVNTEFIRVIDDHTLQMRVWERGSGETWACGTGACASVAASVRNGFIKAGEPVTVHLHGGNLVIACTDEYQIEMTGSCTKVYDGVFEYED